MTEQTPRRFWRFPMRWKLLMAFAAAFTVVFAFIAVWVVNYASDNAKKRITGQLLEITEGAARDLNARRVAEVAALPAGSSDTVSSTPASVRPLIFATSSAERCSMGMSATPSDSVKSMVGEGKATKNGTPVSWAASAFR